MSTGPKATSVQTVILIHPAVWHGAFVYGRHRLSNEPSTNVHTALTASKWDQNVSICRFLDDFGNKGRKVCCKVSLYIKTVSGNVVAHSIAFRYVVSIYWQGTTPSQWNLASKWPALSCQWYRTDVRTHNLRTDSHRIFKLDGGVDHWPKSKGQRSRSQGHVTYQQQ